MTDRPEMIYRADGSLVVETRFRVRFYETDAMSIVHHAAYINWFEEGRSSYTRALDYPYSQLEKEGVSLAVAEVSARYHRPARYDDEVVVATCLEQIGSRGMTFAYEIRRAADGELLVSGRTSHISIDHRGRVIRVPDQVRERYSGRRAK
jgi:acyl-CoA thioester hydrolase